jgi:hypothetical protein
MSEPAFVIRPSDEVIQQAVQPTAVTDSAGRVITLQKPGVLAQFRLIKMLGEAAQNQVYVGMVLPLLFISAIDGEPVAKATTERELEALIQRLDEHGVLAVAEGVQKHFGGAAAESDAASLKN